MMSWIRDQSAYTLFLLACGVLIGLLVVRSLLCKHKPTLSRILAQSAYTLCLLACGVLLGLSVAGFVLLENPIYYHNPPAAVSPDSIAGSPQNKWQVFGSTAVLAVFCHIVLLYSFPLTIHSKRLKAYGEFWIREDNVPLGSDIVQFWFSSGALVVFSAYIGRVLYILLANLAIPFHENWLFAGTVIMTHLGLLVGAIIMFGGSNLTFRLLNPEREKMYPFSRFRPVAEPAEQEPETDKSTPLTDCMVPWR